VRRGWCAAGVILLAGVASCSSFENSPSSSSSTPNVDLFAADRGSLLVNDLIGCGDCHTSDPTKPFGGGTKFPIDQDGHYVYSRNITPDPTTGLTLTEDQFVTMMQTGEDFRNHGQVLIVMPWPNFRWMTTDDLKAIYEFLQLLPAANNQVPPDNKGIYAAVGPVPLPTEYNEGEETRPLPPASSPDLLGPPTESTDTPDPDNAVRGAALLPLAYAKMPGFYNRTSDEQASFGRGSYLVNAGACNDCHTNKGGQSRNLTPGPGFLQIPADYYLIGGATFSDPSSLQTLLKQTRSMSQNLIGKSGWFNQAGHSYLSFAEEIDTISHSDDNPPLSLGWPMPANHLRNLPEQDLQDIYTYMKILAEDYKSTTQVDKQTQDPARYCTSNSDCQSGQTCWIDSSSAKTVGNQCLSTSCMTDADCNACQHCVTGACQAPSASDSCLTQGI
jgi:mono/diheme cytochrome c family protein